MKEFTLDHTAVLGRSEGTWYKMRYDTSVLAGRRVRDFGYSSYFGVPRGDGGTVRYFDFRTSCKTESGTTLTRYRRYGESYGNRYKFLAWAYLTWIDISQNYAAVEEFLRTGVLVFDNTYDGFSSTIALPAPEDSSSGYQICIRAWQGRIQATGTKGTSGTVKRGATFDIAWTTDAEDSDELNGTGMYVELCGVGGSSVDSKYLGGGVLQYTVDTAPYANYSGVQWRVKCTANATGTVTYTPWYTVELGAVNASVRDLRPSGRTYYGFEQLYSWAFVVDSDSDPLGVIKQQSAVLEYRNDDMAEPAQFASVAGTAASVRTNTNVLPKGAYEWRVTVTSTAGSTHTSSWISCTNAEVPVTVTGMTPADGDYAPRNVDNRFAWTFAADSSDAPGQVSQTAAVLYYKADNESEWHTVEIAGDAQWHMLPAGTFAAGAATVAWYVRVTASTGTTATSDTTTVYATDAKSNPTAISPAGEYLDDTLTGIVFVWQHAVQTGTPQTGWELSYSTDSGASWTVLASGEGADNRYQASAKTFANGTVYWRVRTKNTDGVWGNYSASAVFAIRRAPAMPSINYYDNKPLLVIGWQSAEQTGYEVELDGSALGMQYGTDKRWQSDQVLADGQHLVRVRITNVYGDISPWAEQVVTIANRPGTAAKVTAKTAWGEVRLSWQAADGTKAAYLLRDGAPIAKADGAEITDRATAGMHRYTVRTFDADGYYTDSRPVQAAPVVPYAAIGLLAGRAWLAVKYSPDRQGYSRSTAEGGTLQRYWGQTHPVWQPNGQKTVTHTIQYAYKDAAELDALRAMLGQEIVYKDRSGHLAAGIFSEMSESAAPGYTTFALTITETEREAVRYDPV